VRLASNILPNFASLSSSPGRKAPDNIPDRNEVTILSRIFHEYSFSSGSHEKADNGELIRQSGSWLNATSISTSKPNRDMSD
jgi:hypothetical protein